VIKVTAGLVDHFDHKATIRIAWLRESRRLQLIEIINNNYDNLYGAVTRPYRYKGASPATIKIIEVCNSFILNIYIAPLQENYSEALQTFIKNLKIINGAAKPKKSLLNNQDFLQLQNWKGQSEELES